MGLSVIQPGLFLVLQRFPDRKEELRNLYRTSESFQSICHNYQECAQALDYWTNSDLETAPDRQREYTALIDELEAEITLSLKEKGC